MGSSVKQLVQVAVEAANGRQLLLASTAVSSPQSVTTQPSGGQGMFVYIEVTGAASTGTVTITGKKIDGSTATAETTPTIPVATNESPVYQYCTQAIYGSIDASGITSTGLSSAQIAIYGVYAPKFLVPMDFDSDEKFDFHSPADRRGLYEKDIRIVQMDKHIDISKADSSLYPESSEWLIYAIAGAPSSTGFANPTPTACLATAAVTGSPFSSFTAPRNPGMIMQVVVSGTSVAGTVVITGVTVYGFSATETITVPASGSGNYYSANAYVSLTTVSTTGLTSGSIALNGYFGHTKAWTSTIDPLSSIQMSHFDGTVSSAHPWGCLTDATFEMDQMKEISIKCKGFAQDKIPLGDRTTSLVSTSRLPSIAQPVDNPLVGRNCLFYIDSLTGTPFTTQDSTLMTCKVEFQTGLKPTFTANGTQLFSRTFRDARVTKLSARVVFENLLQYEKFRTNTQEIFGVIFNGGFIGNLTAGNVPLYKYWRFTLPAKYETFKRTVDGEKVVADIEATCQYTESLGYSYKIETQNYNAPTYTS